MMYKHTARKLLYVLYGTSKFSAAGCSICVVYDVEGGDGSQLEQTHLLASFILPPPALYNHWHAASPISLI